MMKKFKFLGLLSFVLFGINFWYCVDLPSSDNVFDEYDWYYSYQMFTAQAGSQSNPTEVNLSSSYDFVCMRHDLNTLLYFSFDRSTWNGVWVNSFTCVPSWRTIYLYWDTTAKIYFFKQWVWIVPILSSQECQLEYSLIPISEVDSEYCQTNNLCPEVSNWLSTLYINDIRHESMPFIYVNIPEEFQRDYSTWINDFTIDVEWYNVDTEYISWVIDTQKNKPSQTDFNNIITDIIPLFVPWLVIILFIYFVFRFLKKIF